MGTVHLIVKLEIVDVDQAQGKGCVLILFKLPVQNLEEELQVDKTGQFILLCFGNCPFVDIGIVHRIGTDIRCTLNKIHVLGIGDTLAGLAGQ